MITKGEYIEYLIASPRNYTCSNLAGHKEVSRDSVSDFLAKKSLFNIDSNDNQNWRTATLIEDYGYNPLTIQTFPMALGIRTQQGVVA
jgi:cobalamin biosynthesis protein CbiG